MKKTILFLALFALCAGTAFAQEAELHVVSTRPSHRTKNVPNNAQIYAKFSEPVNCSSITSNSFYLKGSMGSNVPGDVSCSGNSATFIPFTRLLGSTSYTATVSGVVTGTDGDDMERDYSWTFTTGQ